MSSQKDDSIVQTETSRKWVWGTIAIVSVVRIIFAILTLATFVIPFLIIYLFAIFIIPPRPYADDIEIKY